jgi:hypothetical protein
LTNLNGGFHENLVVDATVFSACSSSYPAFIDFHMIAKPAAKAVLLWAHHARAEFVQYREGSLVAR